MSRVHGRLGIALLTLGSALFADATAIAAGRDSGANAQKEANAHEDSAPVFSEDEFDSLDLLQAAAQLRPRLRVLQDFTVDEQYDGASVDTYATDLRASIAAPVTKKLALRLSARLELTASDFHGDRSFLDTGRNSGDPFDTLLDNRFRLEARYLINDSWALLGSTQLNSSWEEGSKYADGLQGSGVVAVGYLFRERLSLVAGLRVGTQLATNRVRFRPVLQIGWRVTDDVEIETRNLGLRVAYRWQPGLKFFVSGEWSQQSWRLEDRGGEIGKGLIQNRTVPAILGVSWKPSKHWRLRAHAGAIAYQRYTVRDDDRDKTDRQASDGPAFTGRLDLQYRF